MTVCHFVLFFGGCVRNGMDEGMNRVERTLQASHCIKKIGEKNTYQTKANYSEIERIRIKSAMEIVVAQKYW